MPSTLIAHNPKFDAKLVDREALVHLPEPQGLGKFHKPVPHYVLVDAINEEVDRRGWLVERQQLALSQAGEALFGVIDLRPAKELTVGDGRGVSLGFRSSTNQALAIKAVAGTRVFVCDNLALSGDMIAIQRKSTTHLDLKQAIAGGFDKFITQQAQLELSIGRMAAKVIDDPTAKLLIYELLEGGVIPVRLFDDVHRNYFKPTEEQKDCQPRTLWGLHNAVTRAIRDLTPVRGFNATSQLGRLFEDVVEGEVVSGEAA